MLDYISDTIILKQSYQLEKNEEKREIPYICLENHRPTRIDRFDNNKKKYCAYCYFHKRKTKNGYIPQSIHKCEACNVALCTGERNCFYLYHLELANQLTE